MGRSADCSGQCRFAVLTVMQLDWKILIAGVLQSPRGANLMLQLFPNGWIHYLLGGLLIGSGVSLTFLFTGRVTGMSSVFSASWSFVSRRAFFHAGPLSGHAPLAPGAGPGGSAGGAAVALVAGPAQRHRHRAALVAAAGRRPVHRFRCADVGRLHIRPRHLRSGFPEPFIAAGRAHISGHVHHHRAPAAEPGVP